ncbi:membrane-associated protein, putative, partial [Bodo saltans]
AGAALARALILRSTVMCDAYAAASNGVIDFNFDIPCDDDDYGTSKDVNNNASITARSAILSNVILIALVGALLALIAAVWAAARGEPFLQAAVVTALPSTLMPVGMSVVPSSMSGAALLAARFRVSNCRSQDTVIIIVGLVTSIAPIVIVALVWWVNVWGDKPQWVREYEPISPQQQQQNENSARGKVMYALRRAIHRSWKWHSADQPTYGTPQSAQVLLLEYRVLWYPSLDAAVLTAVAMLTVVGGLNHDNIALCRGSTAMIIVVLVFQLIAIPLVQPFTALFSLVAAMTNVAL